MPCDSRKDGMDRAKRPNVEGEGDEDIGRCKLYTASETYADPSRCPFLRFLQKSQIGSVVGPLSFLFQ